MKCLITSSVKKSVSEAADFAKILGTGLEISRLPNTDRLDDDFDGIISDLKNSVKDFDGDITLHALYSDLNPATKDAAIRKVVFRRYQQSFEAALAVKAQHVVFHSGHKGMKHKGSIEHYLKNSIIFWKEYIKQFEDNGITAVMENVLEDAPDNILHIVDEVNSPNLKICLDTGHANLCSDIPHAEWIKRYGKRLAHVHVHNNFKTNDDHHGIKNGTVNFLNVFETIKSEEISPYIVLEIFDEKELTESLEYLRKFNYV